MKDLLIIALSTIITLFIWTTSNIKAEDMENNQPDKVSEMTLPIGSEINVEYLQRL